jgi:hypothetical protein
MGGNEEGVRYFGFRLYHRGRYMGWAYAINAEGREVGYSVPAICDQNFCFKKIDRGLSYVCGGMHDGGDYGCGRYFCDFHRTYVDFDRWEYCWKCADELRNVT